jgi:hypothetical protein
MLLDFCRKNQKDSKDVCIYIKIRRIACCLLRARFLDAGQEHLLMG